MTVDAATDRDGRIVEADGGRFRAVLAWRGRASGRGLCYFVALDGDAPAPDDRRDRRAPLDDAGSPGELGAEELADLLAEAAPLTGTERRFRAPDGRLWLAQSVGPVWADGEPAEGSTGLLFTSLEGEAERRTGPGAHAGRLDADDLSDLWRRAGPDDEAGDAGDGARGA